MLREELTFPNFNSRSCVRGDLFSSSVGSALNRFQSTLPVRGATAKTDKIRFCISITLFHFKQEKGRSIYYLLDFFLCNPASPFLFRCEPRIAFIKQLPLHCSQVFIPLIFSMDQSPLTAAEDKMLQSLRCCGNVPPPFASFAFRPPKAGCAPGISFESSFPLISIFTSSSYYYHYITTVITLQSDFLFLPFCNK